jgi:hypothetical protein
MMMVMLNFVLPSTVTVNILLYPPENTRIGKVFPAGVLTDPLMLAGAPAIGGVGVGSGIVGVGTATVAVGARVAVGFARVVVVAVAIFAVSPWLVGAA